VEALHRVGLDPGEVEGVGHRGVQAGLAAAAAVAVLADEHRVGQQDLVVTGPLGRRVGLEGDLGVQVTLVVAVEIDLEGAADVGFVVRVVVEGGVVDLHGAVVPRRVRPRPIPPAKRASRPEERHVQDRRYRYVCVRAQPFARQGPTLSTYRLLWPSVLSLEPSMIRPPVTATDDPR
jgi:hypothetical protein